MLRRVRLANVGRERPLLVVNIDGIDEATAERREALVDLRRLVAVCLEQSEPAPDALVLLLTTRISRSAEATRDELIRRLTSVEFPENVADRFGVVTIDNFSADELLDAISSVPAAVRERLARAIRLLSGSPSGSATADDVPDDGAPVPDRGLLESLHHPALLGEFLDLEEGRQAAALDGRTEGVGHLAEGFLRRFLVKVGYRRPHFPDPEDVRLALVRIGKKLPAGNRPGRKQAHWVAPTKDLLLPREADELFQEAISYGMIESDEAGTWRWRHALVGEHLRGQRG